MGQEPAEDGCLLCDPDRAGKTYSRRTVWQDQLWRLSIIEDGSPVAGFGHLEPIRHIPHVTDLDGDEAATLGPVLARVTATLKAATGADLVYVTIFGDHTAHLHLNLAPHVDGDALAGGPGLLRGDPAAIPAAELRRVSEAVRRRLSE